MATKKPKFSPTLQRLSGSLSSELSSKIVYKYNCTSSEYKEEARLILNALRNYNSFSATIDNSSNSTISDFGEITVTLFFGSTKNKHSQSSSSRKVALEVIPKSYYFYSDDLETNIANYISDINNYIEWQNMPRQLILNKNEDNQKYGDCGILVVVSKKKETSSASLAEENINTTPMANSIELMQAISTLCEHDFTESIFTDFCRELAGTFLASMNPSFPDWLKKDLANNLRVSNAISKYLEFFLFGLS